MLIVDEVALLLADADARHPGLVLGAAVLAELALAGCVDVEDEHVVRRTPLVRVLRPAPPDDLLRAALATAAKRSRSAAELLPLVGKRLPRQVRARLADLARAEADEVRQRVEVATTTGAHPDARTRAVVAVLAAGRAGPPPHDDGLVQAHWVTRALREAVDAATRPGLGGGLSPFP